MFYECACSTDVYLFIESEHGWTVIVLVLKRYYG